MPLVTRESHIVLMRAAAMLADGDARSALVALNGVRDEDRWVDSRYWVLIALARHALGEYHEAVAAANWALSIQPNDAGTYAIKFDAQLEQGLIADAERSILTAIRLQPTDAGYQVAYAWLLASAGQLEKAGRVNVAARRIAPDDIQVGWQAAELARLQGKDLEAVAEAYRLLDTSAPEQLKRALLGRLLLELERESEAATHLRESGDFAALVGVDPRDVALSHHWLMRPYWIIDRIGPVATPALLIGFAILLLALNLVTAALVLAGVIWVVFVFWLIAAPLARLLRRPTAADRRAKEGT